MVRDSQAIPSHLLAADTSFIYIWFYAILSSSAWNDHRKPVLHVTPANNDIVKHDECSF